MPKFRITDSQTGRTITISGESPPTEQEALQIFQDAGNLESPSKTQRFSRAASEILTSKPEPRRPRNIAERVQNVARDTLETFLPPVNKRGLPDLEAIKRLLSPVAGQFGVSRSLQEAGESLPTNQQLAEALTESPLAEASPTTAAALGTALSIAPGARDVLTPGGAQTQLGFQGGIGAASTAARGAAKTLGRRALGFRKRDFKKPGDVKKVEETTERMLDERVFPKSGSPQKTFDRVRDLQTKGDDLVEKSIEFLDDNTAPVDSIDTTKVIDDVTKQLETQLKGGGFAEEENALRTVIETISSAGEGPASFRIMNQVKRKLQQMGRFDVTTSGTSRKIFQRASGIVRKAIEDSARKAAAKAGPQGKKIVKDLIRGNTLSGQAQRAGRAVTGQLASDLGNNLIGLRNAAIAAGQVGAGNPLGAVGSLGGIELLSRFGGGAGASLLGDLSGAVVQPTANAATMILLNALRNRKENKQQ